MHRLERVARWLVSAFCLLGLTGCGVIAERSLDLLYPPEMLPPAQAGPGAISEPSATAVAPLATPLATLTWPIPQPSEPPTATSTATSAAVVATATQVAPKPTLETPAMPADVATQAPANTAQPSATALPPAPPSPTLEPPAPAALVYLQDDTLYRAGFWGASPTPVLQALLAETLIFRSGMLAAAQGPHVQVVDLAREQRAAAELDVANVEYVDLLWGSAGHSLVYCALVGGAQDESRERHVELHILDASAVPAKEKLPTLGHVALNDVESVSLLRYDDVQKRLLLVPRGENPIFREIRFYDLNGQLVDTYPAEGQGDVLISPDGRYILTEQFTDSGARFALYDLQAQGETRPRVFPHEKGAYSMFPFWSPDGRRVAYLLRRNQDGQNGPIEALGLWVLDIESGQTQRILEEDTPLSSLVGWTPGGDYVVGRQEAGQGSHYYAVRPDGGDRRILLVPPQIRILGWMPVASETGGTVTQKTTEQSGVSSPSLAAPLGNLDAMAQMVAEVVRGQSAVAESSLASQIEEILKQAGWPEDSLRPRLIRLADGLWAAQLPPEGIYILHDGRAERVGSGQVLLDARLQDQALGLVSAVGETASLQPIFELLRPQEDGAWNVVWSSQGQPYWVATDGVISFAGPGLSALQVTGTSFGLDSEDPLWDECRACVHRRLTATWVRQNDSYVLQTTLPVGASSATILWSLTARAPYALLHECLARLSKDLLVDDLIADQGVVEQLRALGLLDQGKRFIPLEESADVLRFEDAQSQVRYLASVRDERIVSVERMQP